MDSCAGARQGDAPADADADADADLGAEQPRAPLEVMFATVARRCASLVDQQHLLLERLERHEQESQHLAGLFGLDHLAARLRRNSNTLMVLAGLPTTRSIRHPIPLCEVVWAAMSEVNGYQRIRVGSVPAQMVGAAAASDLVHLIAELLENALAYSRRSEKVWVRAVKGQAGRPAQIQISNQAASVADTELERLNALLAGQGPYTGSGEQAGLFIVRTLAGRNRVGVRLERAIGRAAGVVAIVDLPTAVFEQSAATVPPGGPQPAQPGRHRVSNPDPTPDGRAALPEPPQDCRAGAEPSRPGTAEPSPREGARSPRHHWPFGRPGRR